MTAPAPIAFESLYAAIVRRIRAAGTIFNDRVKLVLRQADVAHWSKLDRPYLLVVPTQTRTPIQIEIDVMRFVNPRAVTLVGQFDGQGSEAEYMAAGEIEVAEKQLIYCLCNWPPWRNSSFSFYRPTLYGGMRFQEAREPDVKAHFYFTFEETFQLNDESDIDDADLVTIDSIGVRVVDTTCPCPPCEPEEPRPPEPGADATVYVGDVESGHPVSVTNVGTTSEAILNFTLQPGPQGPPSHAMTNRPTPPANPNVGDLWTTGDGRLFVWRGSFWFQIG